MDRELTAGLDLSLGLVTCDSETTVRLQTGLGLQIELGICSKLELSSFLCLIGMRIDKT